MVLGDFKANDGSRLDSDNSDILDPYGLGPNIQRGRRLLQFASAQTKIICNSYFYRKHPNAAKTGFHLIKLPKKRLICLSSNKHIVNNIETLNRFQFSSDHRPLRATLKFNMKIVRLNMKGTSGEINSACCKIKTTTSLSKKIALNYYLLSIQMILRLSTTIFETELLKQAINKCLLEETKPTN